MAEKKEVMIKAVLEPSNRLLKGKINGYQSHSLIGRYWTQTYETTNGKMGETIDAAVSGRLTRKLLYEILYSPQETRQGTSKYMP